MAGTMKITVVRDVMPCSSTNKDWCIRKTCCLPCHRQWVPLIHWYISTSITFQSTALMKAAGFSNSSVCIYQITWCNISEGSNVN